MMAAVMRPTPLRAWIAVVALVVSETAVQLVFDHDQLALVALEQAAQ
jgi:hypothetical protein